MPKFPDEDGTAYQSPYEPEPDVLYTFSSFKFFDCLIAGKLWFAPTETYNDIHENTVFARPADATNVSLSLEGEDKINDWLNSQIVRCFTIDPRNTLMWAHYADQHKGVCVGFRRESLEKVKFEGQPLRPFRVRYSTTPPVSFVSDPTCRAETL